MNKVELKSFLSDSFWIMPATPKFTDSGIPYITSKNIKNGVIEFDTAKYISEKDFLKISKNRPIIKDDILISMIGTLGEGAIVKDQYTRFYGQNVYLIRLNSSLLNHKFFLFFLRSIIAKRHLESQMNQSTQRYLKAEHIESLELPSLNIKQQENIVEELDKISRIIELKKEQIKEYDQLIKSRFVEMFENKYEKIKVSTKLRTTSGGTPKSDNSEFYSDGTIPWLTSGEVNQGRIEKTEKYITEKGLANSSAKWIPKKSIVIAMYGATAGKVGIIEIPTTTNQAVCAVLPHDEYNPEYLRFAFEYISDELAGKAVGGGQPNISQTIIKDSLIFNPPLEVQREFSTFVKQIDKLKFEVQKSLNETKVLFDSLMQKYFG